MHWIYTTLCNWSWACFFAWYPRTTFWIWRADWPSWYCLFIARSLTTASTLLKRYWICTTLLRQWWANFLAWYPLNIFCIWPADSYSFFIFFNKHLAIILLTMHCKRMILSKRYCTSLFACTLLTWHWIWVAFECRNRRWRRRARNWALEADLLLRAWLWIRTAASLLSKPFWRPRSLLYFEEDWILLIWLWILIAASLSAKRSKRSLDKWSVSPFPPFISPK